VPSATSAASWADPTAAVARMVHVTVVVT
jgi:hypothetical protein